MMLRWIATAARKPMGALMALMLMILPMMSMASGGENVKLEFSSADKNFLYISIAIGLVSIAIAYMIRSGVLKQSAGDEKMQEVGAAIEDGAKAYLKQQIMTMAIFVVILGALLFMLYKPTFGDNIAAGVVACFAAGVAASYIAGYVGMMTAVKGNTRTAHAALTSYKLALETAFRSGAVAGLITVGMGLVGATAIFLAFPDHAMKLLVGFGFGGSLAALFMRVGGGIYTKAADVGADLVGKVEAGIPEDDPRNPAVIADNVGDNVGDCAGMAADVFESYEVTLVAAIVLGAATAAIFDTATWMRLVMFALLARGIGIIASIVGIFMMKGSDDINVDPLHCIKKGFNASGILSVLLTGALAWWMMGGSPSSNPVINTTQIKTVESAQLEIARAMVTSATSIMKDKTLTSPDKVDVADLIKGEAYVKATPGWTDEERTTFASSLLTAEMFDRINNFAEPKPVSGLTKVDFSKSQFATIGAWAAPDQSNPTATEPAFKTLKELYDGKKLVGKEVELSYVVEGQQSPPPQIMVLGPGTEEDLKKQMDGAKAGGATFKERKTVPATLYATPDNKLFVGFEPKPGEGFRLEAVQGGVNYFEGTPEQAKAAATTQGQAAFKNTTSVQVSNKPVPWYSFFICIFFGVFMAFVFEKLTDYYVSFKKKPVQEVAGVATAGPAPMIIQGMAYGMESSVFSVFSIVFCLMVPLWVFPINEYGSYLLSFYGIALVGLGLLTTTGYILAMDTFGPISDNAQGVFEMSGAGHTNPEGARRVQLLDAAGNTTKALTKGFAIATAVVAAVALFHAYVDSAKLHDIGMRLEVPEIFLGLLLGGAAPYLFAAFSINAVGRAAFQLINEVRAQFKADPGIMAGTSKPNYAKCVAIVTAAAQKELMGPGILAIALPVMVAFGFSIGKDMTRVGGVEYNLVGAQALGGFLAGTILSGQLLAVMLANSGGMWDNAKKLIEDGLHGGKGTDEHKAGVVCDTVGDPFKDTAGPALNPLIKVMNLIALLIVPIVIQPMSKQNLSIITGVAALALAYAIYISKKGSMGSAMGELAATDAAAAASATSAGAEAGALTDAAASMLKKAKGAADAAMDKAKDVAGDAVDMTKSAADKAMDLAGDAVDKTKEVAGDVVDKVKEEATDAMNKMGDLADKAKDAINKDDDGANA